MSIPTETLEDLIYLGETTEACPYLADKVSTLRFGNGLIAGGQYRELLDKGYRRNGMYLYRPVCRMCKECKVLRVPVEQFVMNKEQRRVWRRGQQAFTVHVAKPEYTDEKADVYARYLRQQHLDQTTEIDRDRYQRFLVHTCLGGRTLELQFYAGDQLAGVGILDHLGDALSTVYFYFDPEFASLSPGTYSALFEIEFARRWGLPYYYLGYYIAHCASMNYKMRFQPCEVKDPDSEVWRLVQRT